MRKISILFCHLFSQINFSTYQLTFAFLINPFIPISLYYPDLSCCQKDIKISFWYCLSLAEQQRIYFCGFYYKPTDFFQTHDLAVEKHPILLDKELTFTVFISLVCPSDVITKWKILRQLSEIGTDSLKWLNLEISPQRKKNQNNSIIAQFLKTIFLLKKTNQWRQNYLQTAKRYKLLSQLHTT